MVQGFNKGLIGLMVQWVNWFKASIGSRVQLVQGLICSMVQFVQGFNWGKGSIDTRLQLLQGLSEFNWFNRFMGSIGSVSLRFLIGLTVEFLICSSFQLV